MDATTLRAELLDIVDEFQVTFSPTHRPDDLHDESLHPVTSDPLAVVRPTSTAQVAELCSLCTRHNLPITARGSGTGLSGGATPVTGGLVVCFDQMNHVVSLDLDDHVAVVQPGITLRELNDALAGSGLRYPVHPGELSGSLGGNVNTNAGGMRAVRHGVTRRHVLGLEVVLADGTVLRTGAPVVKNSSGYDLTQLIIGSEGTLALVTEVTLALSPRLAHGATLLVPFADLDAVTAVVPRIVATGLQPSMLEYIDLITMGAITGATGLDLGVSAEVAAKCAAYLVVVLETRTGEQLERDVADLAAQLDVAGALEVYVLAEGAAARLIEARERVFWVSKAAGANEILDIVVPRSKVTTLLGEVAVLAESYGAFIPGCGHVGDGNVHLSVYLADDDARFQLVRDLFALALDLGGQISGEHGLGRDKAGHYRALTDPALLDLQRRVKDAFDPRHLLNPYRHLDERPLP
ncbi:MAG: FAD-binding oxidoreductase [Acidimicrobiales bacterium]